jgi:hypothetical protein
MRSYSGPKTVRSFFGKGAGASDEHMSIDDMIETVNRQHPGGKIAVTDDDVASYIREHPLETLGKPRAEIEQLIRDEWKPVVDALVKAQLDQGARASDARVHAGQFRKADALTTRHRSPEGTAMKARLERAYDRRDALKYVEPRSHADRRERDDVAHEIALCESWLTHAPGFA